MGDSSGTTIYKCVSSKGELREFGKKIVNRLAVIHMTIDRKKHGGARLNAGRKPKGILKVTRTFKVLRETSEAINAMAKNPKAHGEVVDKAIKFS